MKANNRRKVFGDAVDLLMEDIEKKTAPGGLRMLSIKKIRPFHNHPFHLYEGERLEDMVASVREYGILNPVIVQEIDGGYEMLSGHNRMNAAKLVGLKEIPAIVKTDLSEEEAYVYVIETNLMQRSFSDLLISEKAAVLKARYEKESCQGRRNDIIEEIARMEGKELPATCGHGDQRLNTRDVYGCREPCRIWEERLRGEDIAFMLRIEQKIYDIDRVICGNLDMMDWPMATRALISQNLLSQSRNLVEHIAVRAYGKGEEIALNRETVPNALAYLKEDNKYLFLRKFHSFLQESKSHYTPDNEGAERLMIKYYQFFVMIRNFAKQEYGMNLLANLEKFPVNTDRTVAEFHEKIAERLMENRPSVEYSRNERMYVHKVIPFIVDGVSYYEMVLTPAYDATSKFDRFIVYSKYMIPAHYAIKAAIFYDDIEVEGKKMPVNIISFNVFAALIIPSPQTIISSSTWDNSLILLIFGSYVFFILLS